MAIVSSQMDLVDAPNATAITAIQSGLATATNITDTESDIRGADGDDLKDISDQIDALGGISTTPTTVGFP